MLSSKVVGSIPTLHGQSFSLSLCGPISVNCKLRLKHTVNMKKSDTLFIEGKFFRDVPLALNGETSTFRRFCREANEYCASRSTTGDIVGLG